MHKSVSSIQETTRYIVTNDYLAPGVYQAIQEIGLIVGQDVSVIGFDDMPWARYLDPALTTMLMPIDAAVNSAVAVMDRLLEEGQESPAQQIKPQLVVRNSTGSVPPSGH